MATLAQIYNWFMTGKKPTQAQFWASWGSFWHKGESIPQSAITNLSTVLNNKAEISQLAAKLDKYVPFGAFITYKAEGNDANDLEVGDVCAGWFNETTFMPFARYNGGQIDDINSWTTNPLEF